MCGDSTTGTLLTYKRSDTDDDSEWGEERSEKGHVRSTLLQVRDEEEDCQGNQAKRKNEDAIQIIHLRQTRTILTEHD